jgi:hypothetical protein
MRYSRTALFAAIALASAALAGAASPKFISTWKTTDLGPDRSFAGRKVVALLVSPDDSLRQSIEEGLADDLTARGLVGVPAYRIAPKEELRDPDKARVWFERAGAQGVVAMRVLDSRIERTYTPSTWMSGPYSSFWGYYGYSWGAMYVPSRVDLDRIVTVETLIFSVPRNKLLWAGVTEHKNPKDARRLLTDLVKATAKRLRKEGFTRPAN